MVSFKNVQKGAYYIYAYKNGYKQKIFLINVCNNINCIICLYPCKSTRLYGHITNFSNKAVENAAVVLYKVIKKGIYYPIRFTYTDFTGEYNFIDIPLGDYIIKAIK